MKRFLIIQTAFLGDVILATPVISELKRIYPDALIDIIVRKGNESLLENNPFLNTVIIWNKKDGKYKSLTQTIKKVRTTKYDEVINLHRFASSGIITLLSKAKSKIGFNKNPLSFAFSKTFKHEIGNGKHEVERNLQTISHHGAKNIVRPSLFPSKLDFKAINAYKSENYVCFAPASVWFTKQLPKEQWIKLGQKTKEKIYLIGGPGDFDLCETIKNALPNAENLAGKLNLLQSSALIKDAQRSFVNDSGPLHISSAMNTPTTAFFCSTVPDFGFGPLAEQTEIKSVTLDCKPCGLHGHKTCPKGHFNCGNLIEV